MQTIPTNWGQLYVLACMIYTGLVNLATSIPVTMVTAAQMLTSKTAFKNAGDTYNTARKTLDDAYKISIPAQKALEEWLVVVRTVLAGRFGKDWSAAWAQAGWVGPRTAVPKSIKGRMALGFALKDYFTANPSAQVADMNITADVADDLTTAALTSQQAAMLAEQALKDADLARQPIKADLLKLISRVVLNLDGMLAKDDPRWLVFGLRMPATPTTPGKPTGLAATVMGTKVQLECDTMEYATRYRFRTKIVGVEDNYKLAASGTAPEAMLKGIAGGTMLEVIVQAVNGSAQGVASDPILVTMPATVAETKPAISEAELAPLTAITPNGSSNGNGNGSHVVSRLG